jgi:hypothetical protein
VGEDIFTIGIGGGALAAITGVVLLWLKYGPSLKSRGNGNTIKPICLERMQNITDRIHSRSELVDEKFEAFQVIVQTKFDFAAEKMESLSEDIEELKGMSTRMLEALKVPHREGG